MQLRRDNAERPGGTGLAVLLLALFWGVSLAAASPGRTQSEAILSYGNHVVHDVFDQNRVFAAVSRSIAHQAPLGIGLQEFELQHRDGSIPFRF